MISNCDNLKIIADLTAWNVVSFHTLICYGILSCLHAIDYGRVVKAYDLNALDEMPLDIIWVRPHRFEPCW